MGRKMILSFHGYYSFLSNFHPCKISYDGIIFPSLEHAYQAAKSLDMRIREVISNIDTPGQVKKIGKSLETRDDWDNVKLSIMKELLLIKFSDKALRYKLIATGSQILVEGNVWGDTYWGKVRKVDGWVGENHLGKLLMQVRSQLIHSNF